MVPALLLATALAQSPLPADKVQHLAYSAAISSTAFVFTTAAFDEPPARAALYAVGLSTAVSVAWELGQRSKGGRFDSEDILAGGVGAVVGVGTTYLITRLVQGALE